MIFFAIGDFFIQTKTGKFIKDTYLSDTISFFPFEMNKANRTLKTLVHAMPTRWQNLHS